MAKGNQKFRGATNDGKSSERLLSEAEYRKQRVKAKGPKRARVGRPEAARAVVKQVKE